MSIIVRLQGVITIIVRLQGIIKHYGSKGAFGYRAADGSRSLETGAQSGELDLDL